MHYTYYVWGALTSHALAVCMELCRQCTTEGFIQPLLVPQPGMTTHVLPHQVQAMVNTYSMAWRPRPPHHP
jgi:hypothetical protein